MLKSYLRPRLRFSVPTGLAILLSIVGVDVRGGDDHSVDAASGVVRLAKQLPQRPPVAMHKVRVLTREDTALEETNQVQGNALPGKENSGIVKSRQFPDLFWVHNDSGDEPRIYPIHGTGEDYISTRYAQQLGALIGGAVNVDWEDITVNAAGQIIIADLGNNENDRRDLMFYVIPEPSPTAGRTAYLRRYFVRYPEQKSFPASSEEFDFDCEAVFTIGDTIYCLSKNRSDQCSTLYRLDNPRADEVNVLTRLETVDLQGQVVGADATPDGKRLVVITYTAIWLFERDNLEQSFFAGRVAWGPHDGNQVEAVCFADADTLKMVDEVTGTLFDVKLADLTPLR
jgi:hypothetical protein